MLYLFYLVIISLLVGIDQFSKIYIENTFSLGESKEIIKDFFSLTFVKNNGAAFSILKDQQLLFKLITPIAIVLCMYFLIKANKKKHFEIVAYLLIISGAIGNYIDRLLYSSVRDFLDFIIFNYDFAVFNVADSYISVGVVLLLVIFYLEDKRAKN